ncbi:unnamed protein product [Blepharisma stoltei]|uniref:Uncharacterized protein n=1 Tax=Blepharisma stoltei TaxID=1481888 RepID=A0AAU9J6R4_9CILI|nr:unnamed protein product [Blepharisma stoltei]
MSDIAYSLLFASLETLVYQNLYNHKLCLCAECPIILDKPNKLNQLKDSGINPTNQQRISENKQLAKSQSGILNENLSKNSAFSKTSDTKASLPLKVKGKIKYEFEDKDQKASEPIKPSKAVSSISVPVKRSRSANEDKNADESPTKRKVKSSNSSLPSQETSATNVKDIYSKISDISMQFKQEKSNENSSEIAQEKNTKPAQLTNVRELRQYVNYIIRKVKGLVSLRKGFKINSMEKNSLRPPYMDIGTFQEFKELNPIYNDSVQDSQMR